MGIQAGLSGVNLPQGLVIAEEEELVLQDGSAQSATKLLSVEGQRGATEVVGIGVDMPVASEQEARTVNLVGSRLDGGRTPAPPARPNSARALLVLTRNSCIASTGGKKLIELASDSLLSTPSRMKLLASGTRPFTEKSCAAGFAVAEGLGIAVDSAGHAAVRALATPGERSANWVKLRPLSGRSEKLLTLDHLAHRRGIGIQQRELPR